MGNQIQIFRYNYVSILVIFFAFLGLNLHASPTTSHDSTRLRTSALGRQIEILGQTFEIGSLLGSGEEGHVFEAQNLTTGEFVAVKLTLIRNQSSRGFPQNPKLEVKGINVRKFADQQRAVEQINAVRKKQRSNVFTFLPTHLTMASLSSVFFDLGNSPEVQLEFGVSITPLMDFSLAAVIEDVHLNAAQETRNQQMKRKIDLADQVYRSILIELSLIGTANYGHFDLWPRNIGFHSKTNRFSILDWGASRPFTEANEEATQNVRFSKYYGAPETLVLGEFTILGDAYSLGNVLISVLFPHAEKLYFQVHKEVDEVRIIEIDKLKKSLIELKQEVSATRNRNLIRKVDTISEFILAAVIVKPADRRASLLKTELPQKLKQLLDPTPHAKTLACEGLF